MHKAIFFPLQHAAFAGQICPPRPRPRQVAAGISERCKAGQTIRVSLNDLRSTRIALFPEI